MGPIFSIQRDMGEVRNGDDINMIIILVTIRNYTPCLYMILHTRDLVKCWFSLHFPVCWLDFGGLAELVKMNIGLESPLLPWVADEKKVVNTFLMKAHALVTMTLCDNVHVLLWSRQECVSKLKLDFLNSCFSFNSALYKAQVMWNHTQPVSVISC